MNIRRKMMKLVVKHHQFIDSLRLDLAELITAEMDLPAGSLTACDTREEHSLIFSDFGHPEYQFMYDQVNENYVKVTLQYVEYPYACFEIAEDDFRISKY